MLAHQETLATFGPKILKVGREGKKGERKHRGKGSTLSHVQISEENIKFEKAPRCFSTPFQGISSPAFPLHTGGSGVPEAELGVHLTRPRIRGEWGFIIQCGQVTPKARITPLMV